MAIHLGYTLSSEEHGPAELAALAARAEEAGFSFAFVSDHYHPWIDRQGQSPFAWTVLGAAAQVTRSITLGTAVTCPLIRLHPAVVAQAAATTAALAPGRFCLGLGAGEYLNEHVVGSYWPAGPVRLEMLEEAVQIIRLLWEGGSQRYCGSYYRVDDARIYTLPPELPPILLAAAGARAARLAGRLADGLITVQPQRRLVETFRDAGGEGKPCYGQLHVCWAPDEASARATAHAWWPIAAFPGPLLSDLRRPADFAQAARLVREEDVAQQVVCGPSVEQHLEAINRYQEAGYDHLLVHQIGPDQPGFFRFYEQQVLPRL